MSENLIYNILRGKNTLDPALKKSAKQSDTLTKRLQKTGSQFAAIGLAARAIPAAFATIAIGTGFAAVTREAIALENALIGLNSVAGATGNDVTAMKEAAIELSKDGMIPLTQTAAALKNLLATGLSGDEAVKVFKKLRDSAAFNRQGQLSLGEAIQGASEGLKNDLSIKVDNAGITKNLSNINKEYADSIGKTVAQLTAAERVQAKVVGISKEAAIFQGDYNRLLDTFSGQLSRVQGEYKFLLAEIGSFVTGSETLKIILRETANGINAVKTALQGDKTVLALNAIAAAANPVHAALELVSEIDFTTNKDRIEEVEKEISKVNEKSARLVDTMKRLEKLEVLRPEQKEKVTSLKEAIAELGREFIKLDRTRASLTEIKEFKDPKDSPEVKFETAKDELIAEIKEKRLLAESEGRALLIQETAGSDEERLVNLKDQLSKRAEVVSLARLAETTDASKSAKDLATKRAKFQEIEDKSRIKRLTEGNVAAKKIKNQELSDQAAFFSAATTLANSESKALAAIGKAAAITQIAIKTPPAVASSFEFGTKFGGPPLGFALAGIAATAMAAQAAKIAGVKGFANGGVTSGGSNTGDRDLARVNNNETILNPRQTANTLFEIANGRRDPEPVEQGGGDIVIEIDGREIARATREQIKQGFRLAG